jgi:lipopolysaccharide/colanic/teichoic acid biosynthesis glycosyltransferase
LFRSRWLLLLLLLLLLFLLLLLLLFHAASRARVCVCVCVCARKMRATRCVDFRRACEICKKRIGKKLSKRSPLLSLASLVHLSLR